MFDDQRNRTAPRVPHGHAPSRRSVAPSTAFLGVVLGRAFSTSWWVAPQEDLSVLFFTQLLPSSTHPIRSQLKQLVYQALT